MRHEGKTIAKVLEIESARWPQALVSVPQHQWPEWRWTGDPPVRVMRSREFLVQVFFGNNGIIRLSVCRASLTRSGKWSDRITWDELQRLKREAGYGKADAVEVYPADKDIVNVANMRHLWILPGRLGFAWRAAR